VKRFADVVKKANRNASGLSLSICTGVS